MKFLLLFLFSGTLWGALPTHEKFTEILQKVVTEKGVLYPRLVEMRADLEGYMALLGKAHLEGSSKDEQMTFWINAYNACMLHRVISHYPIKKAGGLLGAKNKLKGRPDNSVWQIPDVFKGKHCFVAGKERSQDNIEHDIIRKMGDPRIHFALNCAAASCPSLMNTSYIPDRLNQQLDQRVHLFIKDPQHFLLGESTLKLNKVMDWFKEDFGGVAGLEKFFSSYVKEAQGKKILFFDYNWELNDGSL